MNFKMILKINEDICHELALCCKERQHNRDYIRQWNKALKLLRSVGGVYGFTKHYGHLTNVRDILKEVPPLNTDYLDISDIGMKIKLDFVIRCLAFCQCFPADPDAERYRNLALDVFTQFCMARYYREYPDALRQAA